MSTDTNEASSTPPTDNPGALFPQAKVRGLLTANTTLLFLAILTGVGGGLGAVAFRWLIQTFHNLFFDGGATAFSFMGPYYVIILPVLGGLIVGPLITMFAPEAKGHGVPEIMEAVALRGGFIRPRVAIIKSLASSICIGSGGSVGREGPIGRIGAALGSTLAGLLRLAEGRTRTLVACGTAAGIAATFNAPIGGAFFALELILGRWTAEAFAPVVLASVTASAIGRAVFGDVPSFAVPKYGLASVTELPAFLLLGLLAAPVAVAIICLLTSAEDLFDRLPLPQWLLPALGGLLVGVIGLYDHTLYGVGYDKIQELLTSPSFDVTALMLLMLAKMLATSLTLGSGGSGGVFSPSLYIGALLGVVFGVTMHRIFPSMTTAPAAYALTGMGAMFAATSHAPITAVLIVFELTADYRMILPLMVACGTSVTIAKAIYRFSIYNIKLVRRGVHVELGHDVQALSDIKVTVAMNPDYPTVRKGTTVRAAMQTLDEKRLHGLPILNEDGRFAGIITITDIRRAGPDAQSMAVEDIATHHLVIAFPQDSLNDALRKLGLEDIGHLPVVDRDDHTHLLGMLTRQDIISAYKRFLMRQHTHLETTQDEDDFD